MHTHHSVSGTNFLFHFVSLIIKSPSIISFHWCHAASSFSPLSSSISRPLFTSGSKPTNNSDLRLLISSPPHCIRGLCCIYTVRTVRSRMPIVVSHESKNGFSAPHRPNGAPVKVKFGTGEKADPRCTPHANISPSLVQGCGLVVP